jgi:hypothetical protein
LFFNLLESLNIPFKNVDIITNPKYYEEILNVFSSEELYLSMESEKEQILDTIKVIHHDFQVKNKAAIEDFHKKNPSK